MDGAINIKIYITFFLGYIRKETQSKLMKKSEYKYLNVFN